MPTFEELMQQKNEINEQLKQEVSKEIQECIDNMYGAITVTYKPESGLGGFDFKFTRYDLSEELPEDIETLFCKLLKAGIREHLAFSNKTSKDLKHIASSVIRHIDSANSDFHTKLEAKNENELCVSDTIWQITLDTLQEAIELTVQYGCDRKCLITSLEAFIENNKSKE